LAQVVAVWRCIAGGRPDQAVDRVCPRAATTPPAVKGAAGRGSVKNGA
jgi:hypothetical protein